MANVSESAGGAEHAGHDDHAHPAFLQHHFDTPAQQFNASKLGMWVFIATEILMFGGLFCAYAIWRGLEPEIFDQAHHFLNKIMGATNTVVLLFSSLTAALAVRSRAGRQAQPDVVLPRRHDPLRVRLPRHQVLRVQRTSSTWASCRGTASGTRVSAPPSRTARRSARACASTPTPRR